MPSTPRTYKPSTTSDRGAVIPIAALVIVSVLTMTAFAIDFGKIRAERRTLQADVDAIALDAVQAINGQPAPAAQVSALAEANRSATRNDLSQVLTANEVRVGKWDAATQTFTPMTLDTEFPDAVQVDLTSTVDMHFDITRDTRDVRRVGVAVARAKTRGELGSVLAGIQQSYDPSASCEARLSVEQQASFMNSIFTEFLRINTEVQTGVTGDVGTGPCQVTGPSTGLQLDALSWRGLGFADVNLDEVATNMGLGGKDDLFAGDVNAQELMQASATALQNGPDAADVSAGNDLAAIAAAMDATTSVNLNDIIETSTGDGSAAAADVNVLQLLSGTAMLINGDNLLAVDLPVDLPFVDSIVNTRLSVVEPPQTHLDYRSAGEPGPRTAQVRLAVDVPLQDVLVDLGPLPGLLSSLGVRTSTGNLSFVIEAARADSTYDEVVCSKDGPDAAAVTMSADTGAVTMSFGAITDTELQQAGSYTVESTSQLDLAVSVLGITLDLSSFTDVSETVDYVAGVDIEGLSEAEINLLGADTPHTFTGPFPTNPAHRYPGGITGTRLSDETYASVTYNTASSGLLSALGVGQVQLDNLVRNALAPVVNDLGTQIVEPLLSSLGVTLAGADGKILGVQCQVPALANEDQG